MVDGNSVVGKVNSDDGQLKFDRSNGNANGNEGVGISVRQRIIKIPPVGGIFIYFYASHRAYGQFLLLWLVIGVAWSRWLTFD